MTVNFSFHSHPPPTPTLWWLHSCIMSSLPLPPPPSLVPRLSRGGGRKEREPGTDRSRMRLIYQHSSITRILSAYLQCLMSSGKQHRHSMLCSRHCFMIFCDSLVHLSIGSCCSIAYKTCIKSTQHGLMCRQSWICTAVGPWHPFDVMTESCLG